MQSGLAVSYLSKHLRLHLRDTSRHSETEADTYVRPPVCSNTVALTGRQLDESLSNGVMSELLCQLTRSQVGGSYV
jgi:hypothetical protein